MHLRFQIPIRLLVFGRTLESVDVSSEFSHNGYKVRVRILGDTPQSLDKLPEGYRYFRLGQQLEFTVSEDPPIEGLQTLFRNHAYDDLLHLLIQISNRCLRAIRNVGTAPSVHEVRQFEGEDTQAILHDWNVEISHDTDRWEPLLPHPTPIAILLASFLRSHPQDAYLESTRWTLIEETIQDNLPSTPEQEFTTNAIEHLRLKNYRLALLESIIGLEIVLTRYLTEYLRVHKGVSKNRIKKFFMPEFGLTPRLAGVLDLTLSSTDIQTINVEKVINAVEWRNHVIHRTGRLPTRVSDEALKDSINQVHNLTLLLARRTEQIIATPELQHISETIQREHKLAWPTIWFLGNHKILAELDIIGFPTAFPAPERLRAVVDSFVTHLQTRDRRFIAVEHLTVNFFEFPPRELRARWKGGNLEIINK